MTVHMLSIYINIVWSKYQNSEEAGEDANCEVRLLNNTTDYTAISRGDSEGIFHVSKTVTNLLNS